MKHHFRHEQGRGTITTLVARGNPLLRDPFQLAFTGDGKRFMAEMSENALVLDQLQ